MDEIFNSVPSPPRQTTRSTSIEWEFSNAPIELFSLISWLLKFTEQGGGSDKRRGVRQTDSIVGDDLIRSSTDDNVGSM